MLSSLKNITAKLISQYGAETALVGKIAIAALIPVGAGVLVEKGFEALCEYVSDRVSQEQTQELQKQKYIEEIDQQKLAEALIKLQQSGVMERVQQARFSGLDRLEIEAQIRKNIDQNPAWSEAGHALLDIDARLKKIEETMTGISSQVSVVIQGQQIQVDTLNHMMVLMKQIAAKIGLQEEKEQAVNIGGQIQQGQIQPKHKPSQRKTISVIDLTEADLKPVIDQSLLSLTMESPKIQIESSLIAHFQQKTKLGKLEQKLNEKVDSTQKEQDLKQAWTNLLKARQVIPSLQKSSYELILQAVASHTQIKIIQYLCDQLDYHLSQAVLIVNSTPQVIKRTNQLIEINQLQLELSELGALVDYQRSKPSS